jgi:hypothetical protein
MSDLDVSDDEVTIYLGSPISMETNPSPIEWINEANDTFTSVERKLTKEKKLTRSSYVQTIETVAKATYDWNVLMENCKKKCKAIFETEETNYLLILKLSEMRQLQKSPLGIVWYMT